MFYWVLFAVIHLFVISAVSNENLKFDLGTAFVYSGVTQVPWSTVLLIVCSQSEFIEKTKKHNAVTMQICGVIKGKPQGHILFYSTVIRRNKPHWDNR